MPEPSPPKRFDEESSGVDFSQATSSGARLATQVFGLLLIVVGGYFGIQIAGDVLGAVRKPANLEETLSEMSKALGIGQAELAFGPRPLPVGRLASGLFLFFGYFVAAVISLRLVVTGGRLVLGVSTERKAFYEAVKEFSSALRIEQKR
jgi:hypothetical protein